MAVLVVELFEPVKVDEHDGQPQRLVVAAGFQQAPGMPQEQRPARKAGQAVPQGHLLALAGSGQFVTHLAQFAHHGGPGRFVVRLRQKARAGRQFHLGHETARQQPRPGNAHDDARPADTRQAQQIPAHGGLQRGHGHLHDRVPAPASHRCNGEAHGNAFTVLRFHHFGRMKHIPQARADGLAYGQLRQQCPGQDGAPPVHQRGGPPFRQALLLHQAGVGRHPYIHAQHVPVPPAHLHRHAQRRDRLVQDAALKQIGRHGPVLGQSTPDRRQVARGRQRNAQRFPRVENLVAVMVHQCQRLHLAVHAAHPLGLAVQLADIHSFRILRGRQGVQHGRLGRQFRINGLGHGQHLPMQFRVGLLLLRAHVLDHGEHGKESGGQARDQCKQQQPAAHPHGGRVPSTLESCHAPSLANTACRPAPA
ncbi:hypothetical protein [Nitratidesulfovibrio liaohensis]|uniref:hypothetical protein n=1 Tax=Nitratidesulfovibrio liaohensis TaxID=2604158 RepID=UPI002867CC2F|nr:hypothetical protein [Nitratidesulfovibrio liaohensis]